MSNVILLLLGAVCVCAIGYAIDSRNALARERIRREEADAWAEDFEQQAAALAAECDRLRERLGVLQMLYAERTRDLLAQNYLIIATNVKGKRRSQ